MTDPPRRSADELAADADRRRAANRDAPRSGALPPDAEGELDSLRSRTDTDADPETTAGRPHEGSGAGAGEGPTVRVEVEGEEDADEAQSHPTLRRD